MSGFESVTAPLAGTGVPAPEKKEELILGKFKNQDELVKAYSELEKKQSTPAPEKKQETPAKPSAEAASKAVKDAGLDVADLAREIAENGELSAESRKAMDAKGIKEDTVGAFLEGQKALADKMIAEVQQIAGGSDEYGKALDWAKANLTADQVSAFNDAVHSGNINLAKLAVRGLMAEYHAEVGTDGKFVNAPNVSVPAGLQPFESQDQMIQAMRDPRYKRGDSAYVKQVEDRIAVTMRTRARNRK